MKWLVLILISVSNAVFADPVEDLGAAWAAFEARDYRQANKLARRISAKRLLNPDYRLYIMAESEMLLGQPGRAEPLFAQLARNRTSRFAETALWRTADALFDQGKLEGARKQYRKLVARKKSRKKRASGDRGLAMFRVGASSAKLGDRRAAARELRQFLVAYPDHQLETAAEVTLAKLLPRSKGPLTPTDRVDRAIRLTARKKWDAALSELYQVSDSVPVQVRWRRDYWIGMTLFKKRRQYDRAGLLLLAVHSHMGSDAPKALFHAARALSRADQDRAAIGHYLDVVRKYPHSRWAPEALFLAGWLEFNLGKYEAGIPHLRRMQTRYRKSKFATNALWYEGFSQFLLGNFETAMPLFEKLRSKGGRLKGAKGAYWLARSHAKLQHQVLAAAGYRDVIGSHPFSWYALLSHARLLESGQNSVAFEGRTTARTTQFPRLVRTNPATKSPLIRRVDELLRAGMSAEAAAELARGEYRFRRKYTRDRALPVLFDRYEKAGNFNRPWMLATVYGGRAALNSPPKGSSRSWWTHSYPLAFDVLVDKWRRIAKNPKYWLQSIMRKESGFNPNVHSYADARGLLQMIPATTKKVCQTIGCTYSEDFLFNPASNIQTGAWYIGRLFHKFRGQIPFAAGAFNSGPRPVMRWLDRYGDHPTDEFVEKVSYSQTREYMKKVTETYARYLYLYEGQVYKQPLVVNQKYQRDEVTF